MGGWKGQHEVGWSDVGGWRDKSEVRGCVGGDEGDCWEGRARGKAECVILCMYAAEILLCHSCGSALALMYLEFS